MLSTFVLPQPTQVIASTTEVAQPWFNEFLPLVYVMAGILLGVSLVSFLMGVVVKGVNIFSGKVYNMDKARRWYGDDPGTFEDR